MYARTIDMIYDKEKLGYRSRYSDWLRAGRPRGVGVPSPGRDKNFLFSTSCNWLWGPHNLLSNGYRGFFPGGGGGV
jgi:hypothetical protein